MCPGYENRLLLSSSCIITGDAENAKCNKAVEFDFEELEADVQSYEDSICYPLLVEGYISQYAAFENDGFYVAYKPNLSRSTAASSAIFMFIGMNDGFAFEDLTHVRSAYALGFGLHA